MKDNEITHVNIITYPDGHFQLLQNCTWDEFYQDNNQLQLRFLNGKVIEQGK
jgi:hypothetical protein